MSAIRRVRLTRSRTPSKYPGVRIGSRGKTVPVGSFYGEPTGIVGLRLFPNPAFDEKARKKWDSERYYRDPSYYFSKDLVRRIASACRARSVMSGRIRSNRRPIRRIPRWENLSSNVGAQYFWVDRIFNWQGDDEHAELLLSAVPHVAARVARHVARLDRQHQQPADDERGVLPRPADGAAKRFGKERLAGGGLNNKQFNEFVPRQPIRCRVFFQTPDTAWTPRVLKDGSDSVGALGALNRVYLNIGLFSEEWLLHFRRWSAARRSRRSRSPSREKNSVYWDATELQTPNMARSSCAAPPRII